MSNDPQFWETIFGSGVEGWIGFRLINKQTGLNKPTYRRWPDDKDRLLEMSKFGQKGDLYYCPALLTEQSLKKSAVLGSFVTWVDDPGCVGIPQGPSAPSASIVVQSGSPGHTHQYWRSSEFLTPTELETLNRQLVRSTAGDPSGVDACQLLRVPGTLNYKTNPPTPVILESVTVRSYSFATQLTQETEPVETVSPTPLVEILLQKPLNPVLRDFLLESFNAGDRSNDLMHFAYLLAEHGYNKSESLALLTHADELWGKFTTRDDKELRLQDVVERASLKYSTPISLDLSLGDEPEVIGWQSLLASNKQVEWVVEDFIRKRGLTLLVAGTGVGKSTLVLNLAVSPFVSDKFLGKEIKNKDEKILYVSVEMAEEEIKYFIEHQSRVLPPDVLAQLEDRIHFYAPGYAVPLNDESGRTVYDRLLSTGGYTGVVIDTLSASTSGSISEETVSRSIADYIDTVIRHKYGCWVIVLHHPRKVENGHKRSREISTDDLYGARIIGDRANTILHLERVGKDNSTFYLSTLKGRFSASNAPLTLRRTSNLWFEIAPVTPSVAAETKKEPKSVEFDFDTDTDNPLGL